jgi:hypothetical protein
VLLTEPGEIPGKGTTESMGPDNNKRTPWEANKMVKDYLELLKDPQYANEIGSTLESWLTRLIVRLRTKNQVIDDWKGIGKLCFLFGNYHPFSDRVPRGGWFRGDLRAGMNWSYPGNQVSSCGARPAVRIVKALKFAA